MRIAEDQNRALSDDASAAESHWLNVPNALCALRIVLSLAMVLVAVWEQQVWFALLFVIAAGTDFIDGKLAIWLKQQTVLGAVVDSVADALMYGALLFGYVWLRGDIFWNESGWIAAALVSYGVSCLAAAVKFRRLPSYHMYSAKFAWLLTVLSALALLTGWAVWPLRVAMLVVTIANLESLLVTLVLKRWRVDVRSLLRVAGRD